MRWAVIVALTVAVSLGVAVGAPQVEVRARTQLGIATVRLIGADTIEVVGHLRDKLTGGGIAHQPVTVRIGGTQATVITRDDGSFRVPIVVPAGQVEVEVLADFPGGGRLDRAETLSLKTNAAKAQVALDVVKTSDHTTGARLRIDATSEGGPLIVPVELAITPVGGDSWKVVRTVETGSELVFARTDAGGAGTYRLRAQYAGDPLHQAALSIVTLELASGSRTTMKLSATALAFEDELVVTGSVADDDGAPLSRAAVTLMSGDRRLAQGTTTDRGTYRFEIEAEVIGHGQFGLQVQADPGVSFIKGSRSDPAIVAIAAPQPVPVSYTVAAFVATLLAAGGFFAARGKPWRTLRRPQRPAEIPSEEGEIEQVAGGLVTAKPGVVATLRRPSDDGFSGVVRDTVRGRPIEGAIVHLTLGDQERSTRTSSDGSFVLEGLAAGEWRAEAAAGGHITERFGVSIPHRGELRGARVDLVPVRERVFQLYRRAAEPVLPEARLWGIWSPRQIVDHVRARRPSPALAELTDFVEEIYFSARLAEETVLPQAESRVSHAVTERARPPRT